MASGNSVACSLEGLGSKLATYADNVTAFFQQFTDHLSFLADLVELADKNMHGPGPKTKLGVDLKRMHGSSVINNTARATEDAFWKHLQSRTSAEIEERSNELKGFWADPDPNRGEDLYVAAWGEYWTFDWEQVSRLAQNKTNSAFFATPAKNRLLLPQNHGNLTQLCLDQGLAPCLGSMSESCPGWCRSPQHFNNSWMIYELLLTHFLTDYFTVLGPKFKSSAFAWYFFGVADSFVRYWPPVTSGVLGMYLRPDFGFPKVHFLGPILNPSKVVTWSPMYYDVPSSNLMVTGMAPVYVAGKWLGGVCVDITMFRLAPLLEQFTGTEHGFSILIDSEGVVVAAAENIYSLLFCPSSIKGCNGSKFEIGDETAWNVQERSGLGSLGPPLSASHAFSKEGNLLNSILGESSGLSVAKLIDGEDFYVTWTILSDVPITGGPIMILCVPRREIDNAAVPLVTPKAVQFLDEENSAKVTIKNGGALDWIWRFKKESHHGSFSVSPNSGKLSRNQEVMVMVQRTNIEEAVLTFEGTGQYGTCFVPQTVVISRKTPVVEESNVAMILAIVLGVLGGILLVIATVLGIRWAVKLYAESKRLLRESALFRKHLLEEKLAEGLRSMDTLSYPMVIVSGAMFYSMPRAEMSMLHEGVRNSGKLVILDTVPMIECFTQEKGNKIIFFSYQRLSWDNTPPDERQLDCMKAALKMRSEQMELPMERIYVWLDVLSIPQVHAETKSLAVKSIYVYATYASDMVIICPASVHEHTYEETGAESYKRRVWCRVEQIAHACRQGVESMYVCTEDGLVSLPPGWLDTVSRVFDGDMTCCRLHHTAGPCDKISLVPVMLAFYYNMFLQHCGCIPQSSNFDLLWSIIMKDKSGIFPTNFEYSTLDAGMPTTETRELFGKTLALLEQFVLEDEERAVNKLMSASEDSSLAMGKSRSLPSCPETCPKEMWLPHFSI